MAVQVTNTMVLIIIMLLVIAIGIILIVMSSGALGTSAAKAVSLFNIFGSV